MPFEEWLQKLREQLEANDLSVLLVANQEREDWHPYYEHGYSPYDAMREMCSYAD